MLFLLYKSYRIEYFINNVNSQNIIYCFWTGNNEMSANRRKSFNGLKENSESNVILIDSSNLESYILPDQPLHEAFPYLSYTHRADYLRTYFMHFHGGGYSDIKDTPTSWTNAFNDMNSHPDVYINGYPEKSAGDVAYGPVSHLYEKLVGNCSYIVRPNTPFTEEWYNEMMALLDQKLPLLKQMTVDPNVPDNQSDQYPIQWNEMLGRIYHKVLAKYVDSGKILYSVPYPITNEYR
jgi:hypothetical protein